jgi:hypothetical protein
MDSEHDRVGVQTMIVQNFIPSAIEVVGVPPSLNPAGLALSGVHIRYRRNGYVHPQEIGRLSGRHREQARSHLDLGTSARDRSAVRPPSRASPLPQWIWVHPRETGQLSGRNREQSSVDRLLPHGSVYTLKRKVRVTAAACFPCEQGIQSERISHWRKPERLATTNS